MIRACSYLKAYRGGLIIGLAVVWMALAPRPACGQSSWPSYPNNTAISVTSGGNVGIGTENPTARLHAAIGTLPSGEGNGIIATQTDAFTPNTDMLRTTLWRAATGSGWDYALWRIGRHVDASNIAEIEFGVNALAFRVLDAARLTVNHTGNVGIGTTSPQYKLAVNGTIGAKEVIVTNTGWPDYVFKPGYRLRPLGEVASYIRTHRHLPGIPSEAEVKEKGVSVGEMQARLLAKIEELTLHMIQQDQENRELRERIAQLETRVAGTGAPAAGR